MGHNSLPVIEAVPASVNQTLEKRLWNWPERFWAETNARSPLPKRWASLDAGLWCRIRLRPVGKCRSRLSNRTFCSLVGHAGQNSEASLPGQQLTIRKHCRPHDALRYPEMRKPPAQGAFWRLSKELRGRPGPNSKDPLPKHPALSRSLAEDILLEAYEVYAACANS